MDALIEATREMVRVLKPTGSIFVNLGDKYAGSGGHNNAMGSGGKLTLSGGMKKLQKQADAAHVHNATRRNAPDRYNQNSDGIRAESLMGLPWRYANAVVDRLGLILRRDLIWHKPNGLPESVTDRCRSSHEYWFHFVKEGQYFSAMDEIREAHSPASLDRYRYSDPDWTGSLNDHADDLLKGNRNCNPLGNPLGKLPGSVWTITSEPLVVPDWAKEKYDLPDHFAAFPQEWPRRLILGWSPSGICTACGEGRPPVVEKDGQSTYAKLGKTGRDVLTREDHVPSHVGAGNTRTENGTVPSFEPRTATITGYACACDVPIAPTRPAIVLDPFGGTGTVAMVARALGRTGLNADLSSDYCRLARWRIYESGHAAKSEDRTWRDAQGAML